MNTEELFNKIIEQATRLGVKKIAGILLAFWVAFRIAGWLETQTRGLLRGRGVDHPRSAFFGALIRWLMILAAIVACLGVFGIEPTGFAAMIGALALSVGLAFQGTMSNFAAGIMMMTFRPFKVGDVVDVGQVGFVAQLGPFATAFDTLDNRRIILPNSKVAAGVIENWSKNRLRRVDVPVGVAYAADVDQTRAVLEQAAATIPGRDPQRGHEIFLAALGDSAVNWEVRVWCKSESYWEVWQATVRAAKIALDAAQLSIPFPQVDVHLDRQALALVTSGPRDGASHNGSMDTPRHPGDFR